MPRRDRKVVNVSVEAHAALLAYQRELRDLHSQGVIQLPPEQVDWPSPSYCLLRLLETVKAHRGRARQQRARRPAKAAPKPEGLNGQTEAPAAS